MSVGILPNVNSESGCKFGAECLFPHWKVEEQPNKKPKKGGDKSAVAIVKSARQLGCVSQDAEPPGPAAISRKGTKVLEPIRRVRLTRAALRQANIQENKGPSLKKIQVKIPHQRSPYAMKFEDRPPGETERQERCARGDAWRLAKHMYKLKEKDKATFCSPADEWILPAASTIKLEEREFVVDSGATMHIFSRKDLDKAELETVRISTNPTMVMTANGEVLTKEEATENVKELDLFVTVMLLDTPASSLTWKTLRRSWEHLPLDQWSKTTSHPKWQENQLQHSELCTIRCPWCIDKFFHFIFTYFSYIFIAGYCDYHGTSSNRKK